MHNPAAKWSQPAHSFPGLPDWGPSPVEMTALWQKDRITGRLVKAIVGVFEQALRVKPAEV
jgi:hypothetical protein